jgi:hypothetical protein
MFLPGIAASALDDHGHVSSGRVTSFLAGQIALLEGLSYTGVGTNSPHVRPIVTGGNWTKYGEITQVRVGSVFDTQRRRRRSLSETYESDTPSYG